MNKRSLFLFLLLCLPGACSQSDNSEMEGPMEPRDPLVLERPYDVKVPDSYDGATAVPVVLVLHGYGATGVAQDAYFGVSRLGQERGFLTVIPDGTKDKGGKRFWNASSACCDRDGTQVNDVAYLRAVLTDVQKSFKVDRSRVYVIGHSNGGFMAYRLACEISPMLAAIVSLAGADEKDGSRCKPSNKVAVLQIHGDMDEAVPYEGAPSLPSALESATAWARRNGCSETGESAGERDYDRLVQGNETEILRFLKCPPNEPRAAAELWRMRGSSHVPVLQQGFLADVYAFMKEPRASR